ncbi:hypothetical protein ABQZ69_04255 [Xanthomonas sp. WHRI 8391]|uniref:hypothetical protein n=1 Tax=Xanthomonas sp. WHRI 8391 TaxID=3161573 RepID=UPI001A2BCED3|nr:hypothetical protein [Xanthomonas hortorum pv. carotae]
MNDQLERFLLAAAAMRFTEKDIYRLIDALKEADPSSLAKTVNLLRQAIPGIVIDSIDFNFTDTLTDQMKRNASSGRRDNIRFQEDDVGLRVDHLLKGEAGLTTKDAVSMLTKRLINEGVLNPREAPPLSRKAFYLWANKLATIVAPKELLRAATIIRSDILHAPRADWTSAIGRRSR